MYGSYELMPIHDGRKSFYGKAIVWQEDGRKVLQSYSTRVCAIEDGELRRLSGYYMCESATTQRHIREFCRQEGVPYGGVSEWRGMEVVA